MKLNRKAILIFIFISLPSLSYGGNLEMKNKNAAIADKIVQKLENASERLKAKYKEEIITEQEAIRIAREYRQNKEYEFVYDQKSRTSTENLKNENYKYGYEIDWEHPHIRLEQRSLKKNGSLSSGFGKKVLVWSVWFLPLQGVDPSKGIRTIGVDIEAKTGKVFTQYSLDKL